jgi:hypothetical protein
MRFVHQIRCVFAVLAALGTLGFALPGAVMAKSQDSLVPMSITLETPDITPGAFKLSGADALRIAERLPAVTQLRAEHGTALKRYLGIPTYYTKRPIRYEVNYRVGADVLLDLHIDGRTGEVFERWTGPQADFPLTRGYSPHPGKALNLWYVWLPLVLIFLAPFVDPRRPFRLLHLDLLVLLSFGISQYFFIRGNVAVSVPLVYPVMGYLALRTAVAGFRPRARREKLMPYARTSWLVVGLVALMVFRVGLNVVDSNVMDVGFASVVGADRMTSKEEIYVDNDVHGDTYGPINYLAYVPFEQLFPNDGTWGKVPAAHAAALAFDLLAVIGLMMLGSRLRSGREGRRLGVAMAFAWAAYPFTLLGLQANVNDGLVAVLLIFALLALTSPAKRGLMVGLAAAAKFAPVVLVPLFATGTGEERRARSWPVFAAAFTGVVVLSIVLYLPPGGLREFYDCTIGYQMTRTSALSLWGLHPSLGWLQDALKLGGVLFAVALAFVPGRRDLRQVAALGASVVIVSQMGANHWFYFYIPWFVPYALVTMFGAYRATEPGADTVLEPAAEPSRPVQEPALI